MKNIYKADSLRKIDRIYAYKLKAAQLAVQEQKSNAELSRIELVERQAKVQSLEDKLAENQRHMEDPEVSKSAQAIQAAFRYRHWLNYDTERQAYYVELTQQELDEKLVDLQARQQEVAKINAKLDTLHTLMSNVRMFDRLIEEESLEEEIHSLTGSRSRTNV